MLQVIIGHISYGQTGRLINGFGLPVHGLEASPKTSAFVVLSIKEIPIKALVYISLPRQ